MVCGSLEEMPEKSWVARLQALFFIFFQTSFSECIMVCGSLEEMPEKSWVARLQAGLAALVAFSGIVMVGCTLIS